MAATAPKRPIQPEDLFRLRFPFGARLSPDGKKIVYGVSQVDTASDKENVALHLLDLETGDGRPLTSGASRDTGARWSPDGGQIAFVSQRAGLPQIYLISPGGGEARALTATPLGVGTGPIWSPDGTQIMFTSSPADFKPRDPKAPYRVTRPLYRFDGFGYVDDVIQDIYIIPAGGGEARTVVSGPYIKIPVAWSPDGREFLFLAMMNPEENRLFPRLCSSDLQGRVRELVGADHYAMTAAYTPDGRRVVYMGGRMDRPEGSKSDLWVIAVRGGEPECRTAGLACGIGGGLQRDTPGGGTGFGADGIWPSSDGRSALAEVQSGGKVGVYRVALEGPEAWTPVVTGDRDCSLLDASDQQVLFGVSTFHLPGDLFIAQAAASGEKRLTYLNDAVLEELLMPEVEHLEFPGADGWPVEGWYMKPVKGAPPYPTILYTHGGPHGAFGNTFQFEFHMLAGAGFGVLFVNYSGSGGYNDAFGTRLVGEWGNYDYRDSMLGVDYAIARGLADPDRLGCAGLSYGGYMSCWIVGQTDRFKASVPENPLTNLVSRYGTVDIGPQHGIRELGGTPWDKPDVYRRCSPITYAHKCKTPTLLIQGESDFRCTAEQAEQFYAVLKANGCTAEMLRLPGMFHAGSITGPIPVRRAQNEALLDWMKRYVLGR